MDWSPGRRANGDNATCALSEKETTRDPALADPTERELRCPKIHPKPDRGEPWGNAAF